MKKVCFLLASAFFALGALNAKGLYEGDTSSVRFTAEYRITATPGTRWVRFIALVPQTQEGRQEVGAIQYSPQPTQVFKEGGSTYAEYIFDRVPADLTLHITAEITLNRYDLARARMQTISGDHGDLAQYLQEEKYIETGNPELVRAAKGIASSQDSETIRKAYDYVVARLRYRGYVQEDTGATACLSKGYGDCSDYSDVLVALLRAAGIPARPVDGYLVDHGNDTPRHTWVEAYTQEHGWVPLDPLLGGLKKVTFDRLEPNYVYLAFKRNDPLLANFHFYWGSFRGGSITIDESYQIEKLNQMVLTN